MNENISLQIKQKKNPDDGDDKKKFKVQSDVSVLVNEFRLQLID